VKGSFFVIVRIWFDVMSGLPGLPAMELLAVLGTGAIVLGSIVALRQRRLKLLIAYSTLAQIGFLFLMFALAHEPGSAKLHSGGALSGGMLQAISHATAKAAMFMAAGLIYTALGHDRIAGLAGIARALPTSVLAFALAGAALIGLPPSGAYLAKELMLNAAAETEQWWWAVVVQAGGIFTSSYVLLVLAHALVPAAEPPTLRKEVPRYQEAAALALALCSLVLGLVPWQADLPIPRGTPSSALAFNSLSTSLWPLLAGAVLAILLGRRGPRLTRVAGGKVLVAMVAPARRMALPIAGMIERIDGTLRQWPAAGLSLLALVILFGAALLAAR
jgi:multicomponent Na+:H+ antiporter subunit D